MAYTIEDIKDRFLMDTIYEKYIENIFDPPMITIFTNEKLSNHLNSLSSNTLQYINSDFSIEYGKQNKNGTISSISLEKS